MEDQDLIKSNEKQKKKMIDMNQQIVKEIRALKRKISPSKKGFLYSLFVFTALFMASCFGKKENVSAGYLDLKEKKLPCTITCSTLSEDTSHVLTDAHVNDLLRYFKQYQGNKMNIQSPIPKDWGVECKLTPMSPDFDIWIITNIGEPTYKFLATVTTSSEMPSIIQAIPIAYNVGNEKNNFIESEQWTALVQDDYKIVVTKTYEKLYSLIDTLNTDNKSISLKIEDIYTIENDGKITYEIPPTFDIDYRAIIQFADTATTGNKVLDEQWLWNSIEIQESVEQMDILFCLATNHFDKLPIYNYRGDVVDIIDISSYLNKHNMGYLVLKKGEKPIFIPYSSSKECLQKAFNYFGLENYLQEDDDLLN